MIEDNHSSNNDESGLNQPILSENSQFLDELVTGTAAAFKKLNTAKTQGKIFGLLETAINTLSGVHETNLQNLDIGQVWALIDNFARDLNIKKVNDKKTSAIISELKSSKKGLLGKKSKRDEDNDLGEDDLGEDGLDKEEDDVADLNDSNDSNEINPEEEAEFAPEDKFFSMAELNKFADEDLDQERDENENEDEEEEEEEEIPDDADNYKYEDFFDAPEGEKNLKNKNNEAHEEADDEELENNIFDIENKIMTNKKKDIEENYDFDNKHNEATIEEIEAKMMGDKEWHMKGEVTSRQRPKGSLLENFVDFEATIKPPPIPTAEYADTIENLIKTRIKNDLFDDPVRKTAINLNKHTAEGFELNFDKSKKGLAEIYEEEYENKVLKVTSEPEMNEVKREIDEMCSKVYSIFDKLTNNNFISGNRNNEMKVITNVPSIQLEEVSNYVTDNKSVTRSAGEMFSLKDANIKTRDEFNREERKSSHANWKRNVRNKLREKMKHKKLDALSQVVDSKFEAKMVMKQDKDKRNKKNVKNSELKSSKFFSNLQSIASDDINRKKRREAGFDGVFEQNGSNKSAKNFKL